jgi:hypothetical protein
MFPSTSLSKEEVLESNFFDVGSGIESLAIFFDTIDRALKSLQDYLKLYPSELFDADFVLDDIVNILNYMCSAGKAISKFDQKILDNHDAKQCDKLQIFCDEIIAELGRRDGLQGVVAWLSNFNEIMCPSLVAKCTFFKSQQTTGLSNNAKPRCTTPVLSSVGTERSKDNVEIAEEGIAIAVVQRGSQDLVRNDNISVKNDTSSRLVSPGCKERQEVLSPESDSENTQQGVNRGVGMQRSSSFS